MQVSAGVLLSVTGALAAPTDSTEDTLMERAAPTSNCGLTMWPLATQGPIGDGINYLRGIADPYWVFEGPCSLVSCSYGTGISICPNTTLTPNPYPFDLENIGDIVSNTYADCYGGSPGGGGDTINAFQYWGYNFNVLVKGGYGC